MEEDPLEDNEYYEDSTVKNLNIDEEVREFGSYGEEGFKLEM